MIISQELTLSDKQAITATAASTNVIDLGPTSRWVHASADLVKDSGMGMPPIPLLLQITEVFNNLTNLKISIEVDDNSGFSSAKEVLSQTVLLAGLTAGTRLNIEYIPKGTNERYLRLFYTVTGTAPTTGKVTAAITAGIPSNRE